MRALASVVLVFISGSAIAAQSRNVLSKPAILRVVSADSMRPVMARVRLSGGALYSLGGTRVPGQVALSGDTGSVVLPAVLEVSDTPGHITFETSTSDPELVLSVPAGSSVPAPLSARGHSVEVVRDSSGRLRLITSATRR